MFICIAAGEHHNYYAFPCFDGTIPIDALKILICLVVYLGSIPLYYGIRWFYWQMSSGTVMPLSSLFACYSSKKMIRRCVDLKLHTDVHLLARIILAGAAIKGIITLFGISDGMGYSLKHSLGVFLIFIVLMVFFLSTLDLVFIPYLFAENNELSTTEIMRISKKTIRKDKVFAIKLYCSCLPWYAMAIFIFPLMFVIPLTNMILASYFRLLLSHSDVDKAEL